LSRSSQLAAPRLPATTAIGAVHLTVNDLDRAVRFYTENLGFKLHGRDNATARLGAGESDLLVLLGKVGATKPRGTTGLYHFAVLLPSRPDLARVLQSMVDRRVPMTGMSDHGVSEALYLSDPDGNGIEIYRDRPREEWPVVSGQLRMTTDPLDVEDLLSEKGDRRWAELPPGTRIGHVHLHVAHLNDAERFYSEIMGFELRQRLGRSALFLAAGGYHHHVGLNTWAGVGAPPPPPGSVGLGHFEVKLPDPASLDQLVKRLRDAGVPVTTMLDEIEVVDPSGNAVRFPSPPQSK
jgi:catechol 2,3-dioxygenase